MFVLALIFIVTCFVLTEMTPSGNNVAQNYVWGKIVCHVFSMRYTVFSDVMVLMVHRLYCVFSDWKKICLEIY